ncbi:ammonium transporter [Aestuariibacter salexigens]|uniref:ammonium transporter n=1 Tax=Aestuariibacter salexigens TaxID=226010 RepID=UPI0005569142|nr:ammonium transporter [Aestuariibacter salexigens]
MDFNVSADLIWLLVCTCLVMFMQAGFTCLESGFIRAKNSINVVVKNIADWCISVSVFSGVGFGLMFLSGNGFVGIPGFDEQLLPANWPVKVLFQAMFCATAVTLISGAVAERMSFNGYVFIAIISSLAIYPVTGHWIWGGTLISIDTQGWLYQLGFHDFAGATVVHSVGGWIALAAIIVIGPRLGRFGQDGAPVEPTSLPLSALGFFLLWIGWLGFNGGSAMRLDADTPLFLLNTMFGGIGGITAAVVVVYIKLRKTNVRYMINGGLCGLVSVTAMVDLISPVQACAAGMIGGVIYVASSTFLQRLEIDDALDVVPVHLAGGIFSTFAAGIMLPAQNLTELFNNLGIQIIGIIAVGVYAFSLSFAALFVAQKVMKLRVSAAAEVVGLNIWEHGATTSQLDMIRQMALQVDSGDFTRSIIVERHSDASHIAAFYNAVLERFNTSQSEKDTLLKKAQWLSDHDPLTSLFNRRALSRELSNEQMRVVRYNRPSSVAIIDIDLFKTINDTHGHDVGDEAIRHIAALLKENLREHDITGRLGGEEFCVLLPETAVHSAQTAMEKLRSIIETSPLTFGGITVSMTVSIGIAELHPKTDADSALKAADIALYEAKQAGRNRLHIGR